MSAGPIVIKIGGSTLGAHDTTLEDLVTLQRRGTLPVVVHGGGKVISEWMERQGLKPRFYRGSRVTDPESLEVVTAVLAGVLNKQLVASIFSLGGRAVGLSGADGGILEAKLAQPELGLVGRVVRVNPEPILKALEAGYIPVVATVGIHCLDGSPYSGGLLNINADYAAGEIAHALRAQRLIYLTDVEGVMGSSGRLLARLTPREAGMLLQSGVASGGMIPKLEACIRALERVPVAEIIDGRKPGALLDCLSGKAMGTRILGRPSPE